jgi:hypothetical protein
VVSHVFIIHNISIYGSEPHQLLRSCHVLDTSKLLLDTSKLLLDTSKLHPNGIAYLDQAKAGCKYDEIESEECQAEAINHRARRAGHLAADGISCWCMPICPQIARHTHTSQQSCRSHAPDDARGTRATLPPTTHEAPGQRCPRRRTRHQGNAAPAP